MISIYNPSDVKSTTLPRNIADAIQHGGGGAVIDDETVSTDTTWSSDKINGEIESVSVDVIDDEVTSTEKTWSSDKIDDVVSEKASIDDSATSDSATWSSDKISSEIASAGGVEIDDTTTSTTKTWSSDKIDDVVSEKASINDAATGASTTWSSNKISSEIASAGGVEIDDTTTSTTKTWSSSKISNEISQGGGGGAAFDDNIISSTKGWTSARIWDVIQHKDMYYKEYKGTFSRITASWYAMFSINFVDLYTSLGLKFTYATTDSFTHSASAVNGETVEFVGNNSGTVYHSKHVSIAESNPIHINGEFAIQASEIDGTDTGIIARIKSDSDSWSASFSYDCTVQSFMVGP